MDEALCKHTNCRIEVTRSKFVSTVMYTDGNNRTSCWPSWDRVITVDASCRDCGEAWSFTTDGYYRKLDGMPDFIYDLASEMGVYSNYEWNVDEPPDW